MDEQQLGPGLATPQVPMEAIAQIESSGGTNTVPPLRADGTREQAFGTYQIHKAVAQDYAKAQGISNWKDLDLTRPETNQIIYNWRMHEDIPRVLTQHGIPVTPEHMVLSYHMGDTGFKNAWKSTGGNIEQFPSDAMKYLNKYRDFVGGAE